MYTKSDIMQMVEEEDVEFIRLQFTDIFGNMKNVAITSSQLEKAEEIFEQGYNTANGVLNQLLVEKGKIWK